MENISSKVERTVASTSLCEKAVPDLFWNENPNSWSQTNSSWAILQIHFGLQKCFFFVCFPFWSWILPLRTWMPWIFISCALNPECWDHRCVVTCLAFWFCENYLHSYKAFKHPDVWNAGLILPIKATGVYLCVLVCHGAVSVGLWTAHPPLSGTSLPHLLVLPSRVRDAHMGQLCFSQQFFSGTLECTQWHEGLLKWDAA